MCTFPWALCLHWEKLSADPCHNYRGVRHLQRKTKKKSGLEFFWKILGKRVGWKNLFCWAWRFSQKRTDFCKLRIIEKGNESGEVQKYKYSPLGDVCFVKDLSVVVLWVFFCKQKFLILTFKVIYDERKEWKGKITCKIRMFS